MEKVIIATPGMLPGRITSFDPVLIEPAAYLLKSMKDAGIKSVHVRLEDYDSGNLCPGTVEPLILQRAIIEP